MRPILLSLLVIGFGMACTGSPQDPPVVEPTASLRYDGLYESKSPKSHKLLRLYPDGHVSTVSSLGTVEQVAGWIGREHEGTSQAELTVDGAALSFRTVHQNGAIDYQGTLAPDGSLHIHWISGINHREGDDVYLFRPLALLAP